MSASIYRFSLIEFGVIVILALGAFQAATLILANNRRKRYDFLLRETAVHFRERLGFVPYWMNKFDTRDMSVDDIQDFTITQLIQKLVRRDLEGCTFIFHYMQVVDRLTLAHDQAEDKPEPIWRLGIAKCVRLSSACMLVDRASDELVKFIERDTEACAAIRTFFVAMRHFQ